jgi:energy-coupling factor transporter ATP-binding protein EcfA2
MPELPSELVDACARGHCLLVAGSGVDADAGGASWSSYVRQVVRESRVADPDRDWDRLLDDLENHRHVAVADALTTWLSRERLEAAIWQSLPAGAGPVLDALARLPFAGAISLSWSDAVEDAFASRSPEVITTREPDRLPLLLRDERFAVLHPWGRLATGKVLFSMADLRAALFDNETLVRTLAALFASRTWLFVGLSISGIEEFLTNTVPRADPGMPHYAIVRHSATVRDYEIERLERVYNVRLLRVGGHDQVPRLIEEIASAVEQAGDQRAPTWELRTLRVTNIGPFHEAEFEIDREWTVILGDNGAGKSSLIKAIALALCGDDERVARLGPQLLRAGADAGAIELEVGGDVLRTELVRDAGYIRVNPRGVSPVQSGALLALGFPPMRGVTSGEAMESPSGHDLPPVTDDLIPLLAGPVDHRLDDLKQWIVNMAEVEDGESRIARVFDTARATTPDLHYVFDDVGPTGGVLVRTPDGVLPIERLSQGIVSVLTWVGTVARRLDESYPSRGTQGGAAVVLLDEIDAHLHPDWQRHIAHLVRKVLPNVQVVATSHSPLVVGAMGRGTIVRVERGAGAPTSHAVDATYEGWRADQILTSPLFDLDTTRAPQAEMQFARLEMLTGKLNRTSEEDAELAALQSHLHALLPSPFEEPLDRDIDDALEDFVTTRLEQRTPEERAALLGKLRQIVGPSKSSE